MTILILSLKYIHWFYLETAMGIKVKAQINPNSQYVSDIHAMGMVLMKRTLNPILYPDFIFAFSPTGMKLKATLNRLHAFTDRVSGNEITFLFKLILKYFFLLTLFVL